MASTWFQCVAAAPADDALSRLSQQTDEQGSSIAFGKGARRNMNVNLSLNINFYILLLALVAHIFIFFFCSNSH